MTIFNFLTLVKYFPGSAPVRSEKLALDVDLLTHLFLLQAEGVGSDDI